MQGADLILAERYIGHLLQADDIADAAAFLVRYPEVARDLRHVDESPNWPWTYTAGTPKGFVMVWRWRCGMRPTHRVA